MEKRRKLETAIEKHVFEFINLMAENTSDDIMLWASRNKVEINPILLEKTLEQFKAALVSQVTGKMDIFMNKIDKDLTMFTETENPTQPTERGEETVSLSKNGARKKKA